MNPMRFRSRDSREFAQSYALSSNTSATSRAFPSLSGLVGFARKSNSGINTHGSACSSMRVHDFTNRPTWADVRQLVFVCTGHSRYKSSCTTTSSIQCGKMGQKHTGMKLPKESPPLLSSTLMFSSFLNCDMIHLQSIS